MRMRRRNLDRAVWLDGTREVTTRQLLGFVLAIAVVMALAPVVAEAAGQLVTIVDSTSTRQARVDTGGLLRVGDGGSSLTVDGQVGVAPVPNQIQSAMGSELTAGLVAGPFTATQKVAITNFTVAGTASTTATVGNMFATLATGSDCSSMDLATDRLVTSQGVTGFDGSTASFAPPLIVTRADAPGMWCIRVSHGANLRPTVVGYVVP
jgi:hypothetical protein